MVTTRQTVLWQLVRSLRGVRPGNRALIAVDGVDGAGKTMLADELVELAAEDAGRHLANLSIDGFHFPKARRYARGVGPETFYRDSYDYDAFIDSVISPFRTGGSPVRAIWDVDADEPLPTTRLSLPADCVLLVDGIFLHRPELRELWDASIWIDVPFDVSVPRGSERFAGDHDPDPEGASNRRYVGGQRLYFDECAPWERATWVVDNTDLARPRLRSTRHPDPDMRD